MNTKSKITKKVLTYPFVHWLRLLTLLLWRLSNLLLEFRSGWFAIEFHRACWKRRLKLGVVDAGARVEHVRDRSLAWPIVSMVSIVRSDNKSAIAKQNLVRIVNHVLDAELGERDADVAALRRGRDVVRALGGGRRAARGLGREAGGGRGHHGRVGLAQADPSLHKLGVKNGLRSRGSIVVIQSFQLLVSQAILQRFFRLPVNRHQLDLVLFTQAHPVLPTVFLEQVLQPLELIDVQLLEADQLVAHDPDHLFGRIGAGMLERIFKLRINGFGIGVSVIAPSRLQSCVVLIAVRI